MADEFQYVKLPDGSYGKFRSDASDDVIRSAILKDFPAAYAQKKSLVEQGREAYTAEGTQHGVPGSFEGHPENVGEYVPATVGNIAGGAKDIVQGNVARGTHRIVSGVGNAFLPALPFMATASPFAFSRIAALGGAGSYISSSGAEALGATPEQANVAGDIGGLAGGLFGSKVPALTRSPMNQIANVLRYPATARQSQIGRAGTIKPFLPSMLQRYTVPDWAIPKGEIGTGTNPGPFMEIPAKMPKPVTPFEPPPELGSPENPGWMSKIPTRMPKPVEPPPVRQTPFPGATASSTPVGAAELPPAAAQTPFPVVQEAGAAPSAPRIVPPSLGEPRFTGSEGRAATWTNEAVMRLASQGNREAISQAVRRGLELPPGARYVMGDPDFSRAVYNPRTVTQFTPEGEPIRNVENPTVAAPRERIQVPQSAPAPREVINASTGEVTSPFAPPSSELPSGNPSPFASQRRTLERGVTTSYDLPTEGEVLAEQIRQARGSVLNRPKMTEGEALQQIMRDPTAYEKYKLADKKTRDAMLVQAARGAK